MHILERVKRGETPVPEYAKALHLPPLVDWEPGRVAIDWTVDPKYLTPWGAVFGGYLAALADNCAGLAAISVLEEGQTFATIDLRLSPLRSIREGAIRIEGKVIHQGRSTIYVEVEFRSQEQTLVAKATAMQALSRASIK